MNLAQMSWSVVRHQYARVHSRLRTTFTLLAVPRNKLCYYNRFLSNSCFQYRIPNDNNNYSNNNNVIAIERRGFLKSEKEKAISPFWCSYPVRGMAGHSKWQNIRHIKGTKDKQKSDTSMRFAHRIRLAIKEGGSDPKFNNKLERIITEAKKANLPNNMIENAIKGANTATTTSSILEVKFIGNCVLLVEIITSKPQLTKNEMQTVCRKNGAKIENGCGEGLFEKKGIIHVSTTEKPDLESALELAIEVGAEDVSVETDENEVPFLQFICGPRDLHPVKKALETENHNVTYSEYEYLPTQMYPLDEQGIASLERLVTKIYQHQDVVKIFDNAALLE